MHGVSEPVDWRARAVHPDPAVAATVWVDSTAPRPLLSTPPDAVVAYLVDPDASGGTLWAVLDNPAVPDSVRATLAVRARGRARTIVARYATRPDGDVALMTTLAAALTPAALE